MFKTRLAADVNAAPCPAWSDSNAEGKGEGDKSPL